MAKRKRRRGRKCPNPRPWNMQDVENWFETETGIETKSGRAMFSQLDREPLEKICETLKREIGVEKCYIYRAPTAHVLELGIEDTAKLAKALAPRVKTRKACQDINKVYRAVYRPRKTLRPAIKKARKILKPKE